MDRRYIAIFLCLWFFGSVRCCVPRDYGFGSVVCVCSTSSCDQLGEVVPPPTGAATVYETSKEGARLATKDIRFTSKEPSPEHWLNLNITINKSEKYQEIFGFGGAFTDAAAMNILSLPKYLQDHILRGYYSPDGLNYTFGRVPMASSDFSTHVYSYDNVDGDFNLTKFRLALEDTEMKIPLIKRAQSFHSSPLKLFATPWSAPRWMKDNGKVSESGWLNGEVGGIYYQAWAKYFVRFLQEYKKRGVEFWGITAQNEPITSRFPFYEIQGLAFTPSTQKDFIKQHLGPALQEHEFGTDKLKLMIFDDQRPFLLDWASSVLKDEEAASYIAGTAFHWYWNKAGPASLLDSTHQSFPEKFLLSSEACEGVGKAHGVQLGSWSRAENYAHDILEDLLHWTVGWVDWNLALDTRGGPNWAKNFVDAPIIVNASAREFYRQPMYYALAHFSKFLPAGSFRIGAQCAGVISKWFVEVGAFRRPDGGTVLILINSYPFAVPYVVKDKEVGYFEHEIPPSSFQSVIW